MLGMTNDRIVKIRDIESTIQTKRKIDRTETGVRGGEDLECSTSFRVGSIDKFQRCKMHGIFAKQMPGHQTSLPILWKVSAGYMSHSATFSVTKKTSEFSGAVNTDRRTDIVQFAVKQLTTPKHLHGFTPFIVRDLPRVRSGCLTLNA